MQTQHTNQIRAFLGDALKLVIETGAVTDQHFCAIATPQLLGSRLAGFADQRASILHAACDLRHSIGIKAKSETTAELLVSAIAEHETDPDPTQSVQSKIRSAVVFSEWPAILEEEVTYSIILSSRWYLQTDEPTAELVVRLLGIAREHKILDASDLLSAISPDRLGTTVSVDLIRLVAIKALTDALAKQVMDLRSIWEIVSDEDLVATFKPEFVITHVFGALAKKYGLVKEKLPRVVSAGPAYLPPPPPPVLTSEDLESEPVHTKAEGCSSAPIQAITEYS